MLANSIVPGDFKLTSGEEVVGDVVARYLADIGVTTAFGLASVHNLPILDAIARQERIRFVPARGEAGAFNMADAFARVSGRLGVVITSTGGGAANAAGAQLEALIAGSPVLHITTTVDSALVDRDRAPLHDAPGRAQADMLTAISKNFIRVWEPRSLIGALTAAVANALTSPRGPVTLEIPFDVQRQAIRTPARFVQPSIAQVEPPSLLVEQLAEMVLRAKRPILWLGGGARSASGAATQLVDKGFTVVTSGMGRAIVPEDHPRSLGAFGAVPEAQEIYAKADLVIVAGSRLRGNETRNSSLALPRPLVQIDVDATQAGRNFETDLFIHGDVDLALRALVARLPGALHIDPDFHYRVAVARSRAEGAVRFGLGPYQVIADALLQRIGPGKHPFVRDVTIANATFANRYVMIGAPNLGVHAAGGSIGQGIGMAIGASLAGAGAKTVALVGDGGAMLSIGELLTAVEEKADVVFILMNDGGYGIIRNIQDVQYAERRNYSFLTNPRFGDLCGSVGLPHVVVNNVETFARDFDRALATSGPIMLEVDMNKIGPFAEPFAGSFAPVRQKK